MFTCDNCHTAKDDKERAVNYQFVCCKTCVDKEIKAMKERSQQVAPGLVLGVLNKARQFYEKVRG